MSSTKYNQEEEEAEMALLSSESSCLHEDDLRDLEANSKEENDSKVELEYQTPTATKLAWLAAYLASGMLLTIYNKVVLREFKCPWLLTAMHSTFTSVGVFILLKLGHFQLSKLSRRDHLTLVPFSVLFTLNIFVSNWSLSLVSLALFQIVRNTAPIFTVVMYRIWYSRTYSLVTYLSLLPMIIGAAMTTVGDYNYSMIGLLVSFFGVFLAVLKTIITNRLMTGSLALPMMELLFRISPYAAVQSLIIGAFAGEFSVFTEGVSSQMNREGQSHFTIFATVAFLFGNGLLAFALNIASFQANKVAGALSISVSGNVKQTLTLALGIFIMGDFKVDWQNGTGILLVVLGCIVYTKAEVDSKKARILARG